MTELEAKAKDCIENHTHKLVDKPTKQDIYLREESIFISGYKLGAKKDKGNLTDRVRELEQQIEKMKCCSMCKYYSMSFLPYWCTKNNTAPHCTSKCDKWEIKEK